MIVFIVSVTLQWTGWVHKFLVNLFSVFLLTESIPLGYLNSIISCNKLGLSGFPHLKVTDWRLKFSQDILVFTVFIHPLISSRVQWE